MTNNKKLFALIIIFFAEIIVSLSEHSYSLEQDTELSGSPVSQRITNEISSFSDANKAEEQIHAFLDKWNIAGASVAVAKNEKLIYAKGFGYADTANNEIVQPKHLFRIASISKLITSVAIMKLCEEENITLGDKVFGKNGILNDSIYQDIRDPRVKDITIEHLLTHAGGWSKYSGDPVFMPYTIKSAMNVSLPVSLETTIQYTLQYRSLDFEPGTETSYSNFGYAVLGKVIERLSGMSYEQYVTSQVLNPIGVYDMHLGRSRETGSRANEVHYYSNSRYKRSYSSFEEGEIVNRQYGGNNLEVLGAAGAWVASPAELLKLLVHIDGFNDKQDILSEESIQKMIQHDDHPTPIGWVSTNCQGTWRRTGTLTGTSALLKRSANGVSWVILLNTSNAKGPDFTKYLDKLMTSFVNQVDQWPDYDLFYYSNPRPLYSYQTNN